MAVLASKPKTFFPKPGNTALSNPIIAPTKALTKTSKANCCQFACNPACIVGFIIHLKPIKIN